MIKLLIVTSVFLNIQLSAGQIIGSTKCTNSSWTSCTFNQILRCPENYYFNGQYCLPNQASVAVPIIQPNQPPPTETPVIPCSSRPPIIVTPTIPDPLPVKPVCEPYYYWNGYECYKFIDTEPVCPTGHNLTSNGQCVSILSAVCQENYYQNGGFCVGLLEASVECPLNYYWDGTICVYRIIPSCPDGFTLNNGYCEIFNTGECPVGTFMDNFKCIGHNQIEVHCDYGYYWDGNYCVNSTNSCEDGFDLVDNVCRQVISKAPDFECPPRTQKIGSECISVEMICPKGFTLIDTVCVEQNTTSNLPSFIAPNCTSGYKLIGCECVREYETIPNPNKPQCPESYEFRDGLCHYKQDYRPPTCPIDYDVVNGKCIPKRIDSVAECPPRYKLINGTCIFYEGFIETSTNCSDGYISIHGICVPLPKCPHITCPLNYTTNCVCPSGYSYSNGTCILIGNPTVNICPPGFKWINWTCVRETPGGATDLPDRNETTNRPDLPNPNEPLSPGESICPPGYKWIDLSCVREIPGGATDWPDRNGTTNLPDSPSPNEPLPPGESACPPGYKWIGGTCWRDIPDGSASPDRNETTNRPDLPNPNEPLPPGGSTCPPGYKWIDTTCVRETSDGSVWPDRNETTNRPNLPTNPNETLPPVVQPCFPNSHQSPCQPCPIYGSPNLPPTIPPTIPNIPPNCPEVSQYITRDGHISITNIVNVAHHHTRPSSNDNNFHITLEDHDDGNSDFHFETNTTDEIEETQKCCEVITPRQCKRNGDEWKCFHRKYQRCGDICTQPKIFLKPRIAHYQAPILIMPPPPRRSYFKRRMFSGGAIDCSGCINGGYRCSVECYRYDCNSSDCTFIDQHSYCEDGHGNEIEGCSVEDGYYE